MAKNWSRNSSCFWYNVQHETFFAEAKKLVLHEYLSRPLPKWVCIPHTIKVKGKKLFWLEFNSNFFFSCAHISDTGPILASESLDFDLRPLELSLSLRTNFGQKALPWWFPIQLVLQNIYVRMLAILNSFTDMKGRKALCALWMFCYVSQTDLFSPSLIWASNAPEALYGPIIKFPPPYD